MVIDEDAHTAVNIAAGLDHYGSVSNLLSNAQEIYEWLIFGAQAELVNLAEEV